MKSLVANSTTALEIRKAKRMKCQGKVAINARSTAANIFNQCAKEAVGGTCYCENHAPGKVNAQLNAAATAKANATEMRSFGVEIAKAMLRGDEPAARLLVEQLRDRLTTST